MVASHYPRFWRLSTFSLFFLLTLSAPWTLGSCAFKKPSGLTVELYGVPPNSEGRKSFILYALSRDSLQPRLDGKKNGKLEYALDPALSVPRGYSLEVEYTLTPRKEESTPVKDSTPTPGTRLNSASSGNFMLKTGDSVSWILPQDGRFLGFSENFSTLRYCVPLTTDTLGSLAFSSTGADGVLEIQALRIVPRWFGFRRDGTTLNATPFVSLQTPVPGPGGTYSIDVPDQFRLSDPVALSIGGARGPMTLGSGEIKYDYRGGSGADSFLLGPGNLGTPPFPLTLSASRGPDSMVLQRAVPPPSTQAAIPADPGLILSYQQNLWRDKRFEVFSWDRFPSLLIFDTVSYEIQDKLFKRLAFFVEKTGYRGHLATIQEMAPYHGWNAHDYRAEDLAAFFESARASHFELLAEEKDLLRVLMTNGLVKLQDQGLKSERYVGGSGALISISRESEGYLRSLFMIHELFHGLFFIDGDFQAFAKQRWDTLDPFARRFITAYFDSRMYDVRDPFLMRNELMAYCLQQPVSMAATYFGKNIAGRLAADPRRRSVLGSPSDASGLWEEPARLFTEEAAAFSSYVEKRWGLSAGRISRIYQISWAKGTR